jgi:hypothetical protein
MKGDFTRNTFDSRKHFSRVLMQQGRVQLDSDVNEQAAILHHYLRALATDLIGPYAGPMANCGFGVISTNDLNAKDANGNSELMDAHGKPLDAETINSLKNSLAQNSFLIGHGHYYVNGLLCENDDYLGFLTQPGQLISIDQLKKPPATNIYFAYLDVWERHITALQDASIREVALGGPDTATRAQVTWQVNLLLLSDPGHTEQLVSDLEQKDIKPAQIAKVKQELEAFLEQERIAQVPPNEARMAVRLQPSDQSTDPCIINPESIYRGAANQLYRVEIHTGGPATTATFKWSRENGSIATAWLGIEGNDLLVASTRGFTAGQWVELTDDLRDLRGEPGTLVKLAKVENDLLTIDPATPSGQVSLSDTAVNPIVRAWNQQMADGMTMRHGALQIKETTADEQWMDIENGIQIRFEPATGAAHQYRTGDYWLIPARVGTGGIEWPIERGTNGKPKIDIKTNKPIPLAQPPHGIEHWYAPLAIIKLDDNGVAKQVFDLRRKIVALGI